MSSVEIGKGGSHGRYFRQVAELARLDLHVRRIRRNGEETGRDAKGVLDTLEEINRAWVARAQSGVTLASELVSKLAAARSVPEAAAAYQECMTRHMELFAEDGRRMVADSEKLMRVSARLFSNGSPGFTT
jgi:hypothetical protein